MPRNKHPEETIQKILDVAFRLFLEKGYEQTTVLDIVAGLGGMTRGAFYHHFKSKEEVFDAVSERLFREKSPVFEMANRTDLSGIEKIRHIMKTSAVSGQQDPELLAFNQMGIALISSPHFLASQLKSNREMAGFIEPFFAEGMADGSIRPGSPKVLAELFMLTYNFWMFPSLFPCNAKEFFDRLDATTTIFEALGCPLVDEELEQMTEEILTLFDPEG